jgi:dTDP-4-dehydrorhamnose reductase
MNILLLGADGQVGWRLRTSLAALGPVTALGRGGDGSWCGDLQDLEGIARTVRGVKPQVIVNAAAYTAVDRAETEPDAAFGINARACEVLAREAQALGAWLVHYSTDYVFDGSGDQPWRETDTPHPLNVYGQSKLAGEEAIARACERHLILRTSWVFDSRGQNFLKAILEAARNRNALDVVADQWGTPTGAVLLADVTATLLRRLDARVAGLYHLAAAGEATRHSYAVFALECAGRFGMKLKAGPQAVRPTVTEVAPGAVRRPLNSRMDTTRLRKTFGIDLPHWRDGVKAAVAELAA